MHLPLRSLLNNRCCCHGDRTPRWELPFGPSVIVVLKGFMGAFRARLLSMHNKAACFRLTFFNVERWLAWNYFYDLVCAPQGKLQEKVLLQSGILLLPALGFARFPCHLWREAHSSPWY